MAETIPPTPGIGQPLYAHVSDLHITDAKVRNYQDFLAMLVQLEVECGNHLGFLYLPGDIADNGGLAQYRLVVAALRIGRVPTYFITGDLDMEPRSLANFYALVKVNSLLLGAQVRGVPCLLLDRWKKTESWVISWGPTAMLNHLNA